MKDLKEAYESVISDFKDDLAMECQDCTQTDLWELVDGYGLFGFREWLKDIYALSSDYELVKNTIDEYIRMGLHTIAELEDYLEDNGGEAS